MPRPYYTTGNVEDTSDTKFVPTAVVRIRCATHGAPEGIPCWHLTTVSGYAPAICNSRALNAGMNGEISPTSFEVKSQKKGAHKPHSKKRSLA